MVTERILFLVNKYFNHSCSIEEKEELARWINVSGDEELDQVLRKAWSNLNDTQLMPGEMSGRILSSLFDEKRKGPRRITDTGNELVTIKPRSFFARFKWVAAAVLLITVSASVYLFKNNKNNINPGKQSTEGIARNSDIVPGSNRAVLILADGRQIVLDSSGNGVLSQQGGAIITKQDDRLLYSPGNSNNNEAEINILSTPIGGQYKITLPDGSRVWLNAASSLKYPTFFKGNERKVEITGEVYFEINRDINKPFIVRTNKMEVEVLGTHFNINSYNDEEDVKTTLLEGSVKVKSGAASNLLKPGQQAQLSVPGKIKIVNDVDLTETVAWKEGNFQFENAEIKYVMRQLARWYNIEVEYQGNIDKHFGGIISRNANLSKVLDMLEKTGEIKFIVEGKKVLVKP